MQGYGEIYWLRPAYLSTSEQCHYTPSTRIPYKTLRFCPTFRNIKRLDFVKKNKFWYRLCLHGFSNVKFFTKLTDCGTRGHLLDWIWAFLSSICQRVKIEHFSSYPSHVKSGVPQGIVLGSILILLYVNDITDIFRYCL